MGSATQVLAVSLPDGGEELRVAPPGEPLAAYAFRWPSGWRVATAQWTPPGPFGIAPLIALSCPEGALQVGLTRVGVEVDLLALSADHLRLPGAARWRGLAVLELESPEAAWRLIAAGAAVFILRGVGAARDVLDAAVTSFRALGAGSPAAEPIGSLTCGPLKTARLSRWAHGAHEGLPHGYAGCTLRSENLQGEALGEIQLRVLDRRVHVGADPEAVLSSLAPVWEAEGVGGWTVVQTPAGPVEQAVGARRGLPVECWRAVRQRDEALVALAGRWPKGAAVPRLNGRRHVQLLLFR